MKIIFTTLSIDLYTLLHVHVSLHIYIIRSYIYFIYLLLSFSFSFVKNIKATKFTLIYVLNKTIIKTIEPLNHKLIFRIKLTASVVCTYKPIKYLDHLRMSVLSLLVHFFYLHVTLSLSIIKTFLLFV